MFLLEEMGEAMARTNINPLSRRLAMRSALVLFGVASLGHSVLGHAGIQSDLITVWKTPSCGCCKDWVNHLRKEGFNVVANDVSDTAPVRQKLGLPAKFGACHTAQVGGYVLEGHVPAQDIKRLLRERPAAIGLAVPGMPVGSPGMEMKDDMLGVRDAFDVVLVTLNGNSRVYQSYKAKPATKSSTNPSVKS